MIKEYGYEYDAVLNEEIWNKTKGKVTFEKLAGAYCLRSGRDTLKTIAREFLPAKVFIPALACDSMVKPFEMYGHEVIYYKLNFDYSIDFDYLKAILTDGLFLYMDYFGKKSILDERLEALRKTYNLVFIEDRTHNLIWERKSKFQPEYIMASLRKWINIPDGGLLWCNRELKNLYFDDDIVFSETRLKAQCMRNEFFKTGDESIKTDYRKIFTSVSNIMDEDKKPSRMSQYAFEIVINTDWDEIRKKRKENSKVLINILKKNNIQLIQNGPGVSDLYVPFLINNRDYSQSILSPKGIFNTIVWPLSEEQKTVCSIAKFTEEHMLAAPCDQRYTVEDMKLIGNEICKIIRGNENE